MRVSGVQAVVVDIEGTTSATSFVYERLFPYSRERLADYLDDPRVPDLVARACAEAAVAPTAANAVAALHGWVDADAKVTVLKDVQGVIWADGFARGELVSHLFPDVVPALRAWHERGIPLYVYSSGSVVAQRSWFGHTDDGDLTGLFAGNFDTATAGPKRETESYTRIAQTLGIPAAHLLFLTDVEAELDAATAAGWQGIQVTRPGEPHPAGTRHPVIASFADVHLD